ncbi:MULTISPECIES: ABC transporter permease [unclassified Mesorhizobium]|uniref:ABC transporter permease n=1 Tax=unclassified Mesorhizobium TaxID=325217 RepID=UPI000FCAE460|nr:MULTISPECIES: ABC transporter permease [unclassified Mesorhizobium]TIT79910.1 MAG: ABC transporter permease [Mesorhizobium sp.]TGP24923.1 ABC transporter permease [Mesorhizobium sp. M1D.F.Ca.ET.231.01.1.1]TGP36246.1 ABC transporter permease [Mesorhizobium sp. M1D.F.Ca.ET.234.01.1.1]TGS49749.1 ABC transporter permease [Mesorhizobium sp. M1D.F.Ca.ET.184.01.1.1]TGS64460.1 ABC transporter permease [Mesorhizobium sp. M1D.F.Ca.ET.183.01.1.1]
MSVLELSTPRVAPFLQGLLRDPIIWLILLIFAVGALTSQYYLTALNIENLMRSIAVIGLLSLGMTVVLLTGRIDLSVAALMIFSVIVGVVVMAEIGPMLGSRWLVRGNTYAGPIVPVILIALATGIAVGALNGIGVAYLKVASFIMTLVSLTALRGFNYMLTNGHPYYLKAPFYSWIGDGKIVGIPVSFVVFVFVLLALIGFVNGSMRGGRFYAIGGNEKAALYAGIKTQRYVVLAYAISGLCAALAGIIFTARLKSVDAPLAAGYELTAIAIAVIGGTALAGGIGSPWRTLLGSVAFAAGLNLLAIWGVGTWYQNLAIGVVLIISVGLSKMSRKKTQA